MKRKTPTQLPSVNSAERLVAKALVARKRRLVKSMEGLGEGPKKFNYGFAGRIPYTNKQRELLFWSKVKIVKSGCWEWTGKLKDKRYGSFQFNGRTDRSHRVSWMLCFGSIPEKLEVMHSCDNTICVRPDHLALGSHASNMNGMVLRGRSARGENASRAKLNSEKVKWIRDNYVFGSRTLGSVAIGRRFGIASNSVLLIVSGVNWKYE